MGTTKSQATEHVNKVFKLTKTKTAKPVKPARPEPVKKPLVRSNSRGPAHRPTKPPQAPTTGQSKEESKKFISRIPRVQSATGQQKRRSQERSANTNLLTQPIDQRTSNVLLSRERSQKRMQSLEPLNYQPNVRNMKNSILKPS